MARTHRKNSHIVSTCLFALLFIYFCYHAVSGNHGILAYFKLNKRVEELKNTADDIHAQRMFLEHRVSLLKPDSLDLDLLDEQARRLLGYAEKDEMIYDIK